jgi:dTDP-glucose 4,6-dehydratase
MPFRVLVTGGAGFIGSNFIRYVLDNRVDYQLVNLDALTYSGNLENLESVASDPRYSFERGNICDAQLVTHLISQCDAVVHFAAESHVDRSISDAKPFVQTNVLGTQALLDAVRQMEGVRFLHVSTDEVYGDLPLDKHHLRFTESTPIQPNSPYAASKAASDLLVRSYRETYGIDAVITRCSNNFGPYQFPEKVIPRFVTNLLEGKNVPLYGDGLNVRDWLHVEDHCEALVTVLEHGIAGEVYNIGGNNEQSNLTLTHLILDRLGLDGNRIDYVEDRLGHDRRYAIDASKIQRHLGWTPTRSAWPMALAETVDWYINHANWWRRIRSGAYRETNAAACR